MASRNMAPKNSEFIPLKIAVLTVSDSRTAADQDLAWILGREGRTELNADGLLADPSLFATDPRDMVHNPSHAEPEKPRPARGFSAQLRHAAERLHKGGRA